MSGRPFSSLPPRLPSPGCCVTRSQGALLLRAVLGVHAPGSRKVPQDLPGSGRLSRGQQPAGRLREQRWEPAGSGDVAHGSSPEAWPRPAASPRTQGERTCHGFLGHCPIPTCMEGHDTRGLYRCPGTVYPHTYPQNRSKSPVTRALSPCRRRQSCASRARPGSSRVPSTEKRPPATENARRCGGSHSSRPEQKRPALSGPRGTSPGPLQAPALPTNSRAHRRDGAPPAFTRRVLSGSVRGSPAPGLAPGGAPQKHPTVLTSHVQGQAQARQGPPMK